MAHAAALHAGLTGGGVLMTAVWRLHSFGCAGASLSIVCGRVGIDAACVVVAGGGSEGGGGMWMCVGGYGAGVVSNASMSLSNVSAIGNTDKSE